MLAAEETQAQGLDILEDIEKMKVHIVQQDRASQTPDFVFNFVDLTQEYLGDITEEDLSAMVKKPF